MVYVIAADRHWISASYEKSYDAFLSALNEPGRPLGYLFLEKTFQLSTPLPRLSLTLQQKYWDKLILARRDLEPKKLENEISEKVGEADKDLRGISESQIIEIVGRGRQNPVEDTALRRAAILRLATPEMNAETEHFLKRFARFVTPSPLAMKRLVNAYSLARDRSILEESDNLLVKRDQLALWTIADLRWPPLAEYLSKNPKAVEYIGRTDESSLKSLEIPESITKLFKDNEVIIVVSGKIDGIADIGVRLDPLTIQLFAGEF